MLRDFRLNSLYIISEKGNKDRRQGRGSEFEKNNIKSLN